MLTANQAEMKTKEKPLAMVKKVLNQPKMNHPLVAAIKKNVETCSDLHFKTLSFDEYLYSLLRSKKESGQDATLSKATDFILQTAAILSNFYESGKGPENKKLGIAGVANLKHAADIITDLRRELALKAILYKIFAGKSFLTIRCSNKDACTHLDGRPLHTIKSNEYRPTGRQYAYSEGRTGHVLRNNFSKISIQQYVENWHNGADIIIKQPLAKARVKNNIITSMEEEKAIDKEVSNMLSNGSTIAVDNPVWILPIFAISKKVCKSYFCSADLTSAYHSIAIMPKYIPYTAIQWKAKTYGFRVLPFGCPISPSIFYRCTDQICRFLRSRNIKLNCFYDDYLLINENSNQLLEEIDLTIRTFTSLRFPVNLDKCDLIPKHEAIFRGLKLIDMGACPKTKPIIIGISYSRRNEHNGRYAVQTPKDHLW
uniref:Reverse transcriptase domain-containing protein n=1 Tax=Strongyloides papillosus TaxID=174720 RepID=A0A0N5CHI5_STREA